MGHTPDRYKRHHLASCGCDIPTHRLGSSRVPADTFCWESARNASLAADQDAGAYRAGPNVDFIFCVNHNAPLPDDA